MADGVCCACAVGSECVDGDAESGCIDGAVFEVIAEAGDPTEGDVVSAAESAVCAEADADGTGRVTGAGDSPLGATVAAGCGTLK